jgi:hypothetical protein
MRDPRTPEILAWVEAMPIAERLAARVGRKMRPQTRKLLVTQPEMISIHQRSPFGDLESRFTKNGDPFYGS